MRAAERSYLSDKSVVHGSAGKHPDGCAGLVNPATTHVCFREGKGYIPTAFLLTSREALTGGPLAEQKRPSLRQRSESYTDIAEVADGSQSDRKRCVDEITARGGFSLPGLSPDSPQKSPNQPPFGPRWTAGEAELRLPVRRWLNFTVTGSSER